MKTSSTKNTISNSGSTAGTLSWSMGFDFPVPDTLLIRLSGDWKITDRLPDAKEVAKQIASGVRVKKVGFDTEALAGWDSGLITFLLKVFDLCAKAGIEVAKDGLPAGVRRLAELAAAVPERTGARRDFTKESLLTRIGAQAIDF